jgi:hypothetical protein
VQGSDPTVVEGIRVGADRDQVFDDVTLRTRIPS